MNVMAVLHDSTNTEICNNTYSLFIFIGLATLKQSVAVYVRNFIKGLIPRLAGATAEGLTPATLQRLMEIFFGALLSPHIHSSVKRHLHLVFESLIAHY